MEYISFLISALLECSLVVFTITSQFSHSSQILVSLETTSMTFPMISRRILSFLYLKYSHIIKTYHHELADAEEEEMWEKLFRHMQWDHLSAHLSAFINIKSYFDVLISIRLKILFISRKSLSLNSHTFPLS